MTSSGPKLLPSLVQRLPACHNHQTGILVGCTVVFIFDHPPLECIPFWVYLPDPFHVALVQIFTEGIPPAGEVLRPRSRALSPLCRDWLSRIIRVREPSSSISQLYTVIFPVTLVNVVTRCPQPTHSLAISKFFRDIPARWGKRVQSNVADVCERAHGDVSVADGRVDHECAVLSQHGAHPGDNLSRRECLFSFSRVGHNP